MKEIESTFDSSLRIAGAAGLAIYAIIIILWSFIVTGLDNKGTNEPHLQSWNEFAFMSYGLFVAGVLFWLSWRATFSNKPIGPKILLFPVILFTFHIVVIVFGAVNEALIYLSVSQLPLLAGIAFLGFYIWKVSMQAPNKALNPDAQKPRAG